MNIALDATGMLGPMSKGRGIGNYSLNLLRALTENDKENHYFFLNFFENVDDAQLVNDKKNFTQINFYMGKDRALLDHVEYAEILGGIVRRFIRENNIDMFIVTSPFDDHVMTYRKEWFLDTKVIAIVYDIIPYIFSERYLADSRTKNWYMERVETLRWMDQLMVISQSVKNDMIRCLGFEAKNISVIWGASGDKIKKTYVSEEEKISLFHKFGIENKYIMCTGGDDERKNLSGLIEAYSMAGKDLIREFQLVIVCKLSANSEKRYQKQIENLNLCGRVVLTNFVTDEELLQLYNCAYAMIFPSQYEGFGLPVTEAFACELPVVTSNNSSLAEIAGDAAVLVDPFDIRDIARGIKEVLKLPNTEDLARKGKERL